MFTVMLNVFIFHGSFGKTIFIYSNESNLHNNRRFNHWICTILMQLFIGYGIKKKLQVHCKNVTKKIYENTRSNRQIISYFFHEIKKMCSISIKIKTKLNVQITRVPKNESSFIIGLETKSQHWHLVLFVKYLWNILQLQQIDSFCLSQGWFIMNLLTLFCGDGNNLKKRNWMVNRK